MAFWQLVTYNESMENLKFALERCKAALPSEDIDDPLAVLRSTAAGMILVL